MKLNISRRLDYAVRILTELTLHAGEVVPSRQIAENQHIPFPYLQKIVNQMAGVGLVRTLRGKEGGVILNVDPERTTLLDLVRLLGEMDPAGGICLVGVEECPVYDACGAHTVWDEIYRLMLAHASRITLKELAEKSLQSHGIRNHA